MSNRKTINNINIVYLLSGIFINRRLVYELAMMVSATTHFIVLSALLCHNTYSSTLFSASVSVVRFRKLSSPLYFSLLNLILYSSTPQSLSLRKIITNAYNNVYVTIERSLIIVYYIDIYHQ